MHYKLPVLSYQAHKDTDECIEEVVEVLARRESVWVILGHYLVESIDGGLVPKQLYTQEAEDENNDQKQDEEGEDVLDCLADFYDHFMECLPFSEEAENSQEPKSPEYGKVSFLVCKVLLLVKKDYLYDGNDDNDSVKLVERITDISVDAKAQNLDNQLCHEDPGAIVVYCFKCLSFFWLDGVSVHAQSDRIERDYSQNDVLEVVVLAYLIKELENACLHVFIARSLQLLIQCFIQSFLHLFERHLFLSLCRLTKH